MGGRCRCGWNPRSSSTRSRTIRSPRRIAAIWPISALAPGEPDRRLFGVDCDREEPLASLLGVLWEAELGQPAVLAFLEQNWLEGGASQNNLDHFRRNVRKLMEGGFLDEEGRPTTRLA